MSNAAQPSPTDPHSLILTRLEIEVALGLFDMAVKQGGLSVAANAVVLSQKFQQASPLQRVPTPSADPSES